jgi:hypothetical protein
VVWLETVTEKLTMPNNGAFTLEGWTVMTGGGPLAAQFLAINKQNSIRQIDAFKSL